MVASFTVTITVPTVVGIMYWLHEYEYAAMKGPLVDEKEVTALVDVGLEFEFAVLLASEVEVSV